MNAIYTLPVAISSTGKTYNRYERIREARGFRTGDLKGPFFIHVTYDGKQKWHKLQAETFEGAKVEAGSTGRARGQTASRAPATDPGRNADQGPRCASSNLP